MLTGSRIALATLVCLLCLIAGCSSSSGPKLAAADGTVTLQGQPLPNATVMFIPEKGPVAMAVTDMEGKFKLRTGGKSGAVVGPVKIAVNAGSDAEDTKGMDAVANQPKSQAEADQYLRNASELQAKMASGQETKPKSLIPEKYRSAETSGLAYTIKAEGGNHFDIDLK